MKKITVQELSAENFKIYGSFSNLINPNAPRFGPEPIEFYPDLEQLNLGQTSCASFSVCRVSERPNIIQKLEFHNHSGEALCPLDGDVLIHVALATKKGDTPVDRIEVFRIPKGTLVTLRPGVWHHAPFAFECKYVNVMVVLPERTYMNDCFVFIIPEEEQIEIEK